jgi:hypothetical protein
LKALFPFLLFNNKKKKVSFLYRLLGLTQQQEEEERGQGQRTPREGK